MISKHILVQGKVQGVFFRAGTKKKADELGIKGWVKNTDDGHVEIVATGDHDPIKTFIEWCYIGPPRARVLQVLVTDCEHFPAEEFLVRR